MQQESSPPPHLFAPAQISQETESLARVWKVQILGRKFLDGRCWVMCLLWICSACSSSTLPSGAYALWVLLWKHTLKYASYQPCWIKCMYCSHCLGYGGGGSESLYCGEVVPQCFSLSFIFGKGEGWASFFMFAGQPDSDHVAFIVVLNGNIFYVETSRRGSRLTLAHSPQPPTPLTHTERQAFSHSSRILNLLHTTASKLHSKSPKFC